MLCCAPRQTGFEAPEDAARGSVLSCIRAVISTFYVTVSYFVKRPAPERLVVARERVMRASLRKSTHGPCKQCMHLLRQGLSRGSAIRGTCQLLGDLCIVQAQFAFA